MVSVHACPMVRPGMRSAGGMNVYIKHLSATLADAGLCVDVFTRGHEAGGPELVSLGPRARVVHLPAGPPELPKESVHEYLPEFLDRLDDFRSAEGLGYDLVHSHYWLSACVGERLEGLWRVPHVVTFHTLALVKGLAGSDDESQERERVEIEVAQGANSLVAFTNEERETLVREYGASATGISIAPGGVDLERFKPGYQAGARQRLGLAQDEMVVLYVGRLEPFKGAELVLRAVAQMRRQERLKLVVVGGGGEEDPEVARLQHLAGELGIRSHVQWHNACPQEQLPDYYVAADVCVVPSYHESFGFVSLEAMACGTPVIAAPVGGLATLVLDGRTGRLVSEHTPEAFAGCLEDVLADEELRRRWGRAAREWACQFPWSRAATEVLGVYERAISAMAWRPAVTPCAG